MPGKINQLPFEFEESLTKQDYYEANKLVYFRSQTPVGKILLGFLDIIFAFIAFLSYWSYDYFSMVIFTALFILFVFYPYLTLRWISNATFKAQTHLKEPGKLRIDNGGIRDDNTCFTLDIKWNKFNKYYFTNKIIVIYFSKIAVIMIPRKNKSQEEWQKLTAFIVSKVPAP